MIILGQPQIQDAFFGLQLRCPCSHVFTIVGQPEMIKICQACGRPFKITGWPTIVESNGQIGINCQMQMGAPTRKED